MVGRNTQHQATFHKAARREIHQNRAINYIIVHRVSGAGHSHDGLPVERYLDKGGRVFGDSHEEGLTSVTDIQHQHQRQMQSALCCGRARTLKLHTVMTATAPRAVTP